MNDDIRELCRRIADRESLTAGAVEVKVASAPPVKSAEDLIGVVDEALTDAQETTRRDLPGKIAIAKLLVIGDVLVSRGI